MTQLLISAVRRRMFRKRGHGGASLQEGSMPDLPRINGYGLYDMAGYVWQSTSDWYQPDCYRKLTAMRMTRPCD